MTLEEFIKGLNELKIVQKSTDWVEDIPEEYYSFLTEKHYAPVAYTLDVDTRRWYETSIEVDRLDDKTFLGVRHINNVFSEEMVYEDVCHHLEFFEMEEITVVSYRKKE